MIVANELRIGNWVEIDQYGNTRNIIRINSGSDIDQVVKLRPSPIPLTPEILEKCGFDKEGDTYKIVTKNLDYCFKISFTGSGYFSQNAIAKQPTLYLHQLQNLYWCLCGEELTFKP